MPRSSTCFRNAGTIPVCAVKKKLSQRAFLDPCSTTQSSYNFVTKLIKHSTPEIRDNFLGHNVNQTLLGAASTAKVRETSHRHQYNMQTKRLIRLSHNKHNNSLQRLSQIFIMTMYFPAIQPYHLNRHCNFLAPRQAVTDHHHKMQQQKNTIVLLCTGFFSFLLPDRRPGGPDQS